MIAAEFEVTLTLQGPVLTHSTAQGRFGVDAMMASTEDGHHYLPGTLLKGLIGEAWQELGTVREEYAKARRPWLGIGSENQNLPERGGVFFEDLVADRKPSEARTQYRIRIDEERGSVMQGAYQVIDSPYRPGERAEFRGKLRILAENRAKADEGRRLIQTALRWIASAGAERSAGFGRVLAGVCGELRDVAAGPLEIEASGATELELQFDRPVCFARRRVASNLFESEPWITGGALKGSLATMLATETARWQELKRHLHAVRFTHAFPAAKGDARPAFPPLSLAMGKADKKDLVLVEEARTMPDGSAPRFLVDWKDETEAFRDFGWSEPKRELRVRTAIDGESKRAQDKELFAYEMLVPRDKAGTAIVWSARVYLDGVESSARAQVATELGEALASGFYGLGKTKAHATVVARRAACGDLAVGGTVAITLQTAALLCDPVRMGGASLEAVKAEYGRVWDELSSGAFALKSYFHCQSLGGGEYLRRRFQNAREPYRPYLLTDAGSVFLLQVTKPEEARAAIAKWQARGIELTDVVRRFYSLARVSDDKLWEVCPFLPENGYGEIAIDLHKNLPEGWHVQN